LVSMNTMASRKAPSNRAGRREDIRGTMAMALPEYELYAIRYAMRDAQRRDHFIGGDPHDAPMPMDYFVWVAERKERTVVIDIGFTEEVAAKRGRTFLRCPIKAMGLIGVEAAAVKDVALTHLHYDHCGNLGRFPAARFHLQESEIHYATGRYMAYPKLSHSYEVEDVCDIVRLNYRRRIKFYNGDAELASGIELYAASLRLAWRRRCRPRRPRAAGAQWTATCGSWRADAAPSCGPPRSAPIARRRGELTGNRAGLSDHLAGLPSSQRGVRHHGNNGTGYCAAAWRRMEDDPHDQWGVEPMARFSIRAIAAISTYSLTGQWWPIIKAANMYA